MSIMKVWKNTMLSLFCEALLGPLARNTTRNQLKRLVAATAYLC